MFNLIRKHYLVIILAIIVGSLTVLPQILAVQKVDNFQGIYKTVNNDETYYMARARDIIDGHSFLANPYLSEYKEGYPMQFWLPDYLLAKPLAILGINNIHYGYFFYDFLLPFILTLLTYSIIYLLTGSRLISILGAAFLHLNLFLYWFGRTPSPQLNFIFWLLLFLFWLKFLERPSYVNAIIMGVILGLLFHIYTYYWTFYVIFMALFLGFNLIFKRSLDYKKYMLMALLALIISIPYFVTLIKSMSLPYFAESLARVGMLDTHFPTGRKILMWGCLVLLLLYFSYKKKIIKVNSTSLLLLSSVLAPMIAVNQHLITGKNMQFASHYWMLGVFCFVFTSVYLLNLWLKRIKIHHIKLLLVLLISFYVFYNPVVYAVNVAQGQGMRYSEKEIEQQKFAPVFKWLNKNTARDEVVFANRELGSLIPIYTANNVFFVSSAALHFMPSKEFQERLVINNYWDEFDEAYALSHEFAIWGAYYQTRYDHDLTKNKLRKVFFLEPREYIKIPLAEIEKFLDFVHVIKNKDFEQQLKKYRVDYLLWDEKADPHWQIEELNFLKKVQKIDNILIYKVSLNN